MIKFYREHQCYKIKLLERERGIRISQGISKVLQKVQDLREHSQVVNRISHGALKSL